MQLLDLAVAHSLPILPRPLVRWVARPYVAGETLADAIRTVRDLNALGAKATLDLLGEEVEDPDECRRFAREYREILGEIGRTGVDSGLSIKPTALGLRRDPGFARDLLRTVLDKAREVERFVRIDMEGSSTTDATLAIYRDLRLEGYDNVGVVLQSCLKRTLSDAGALAEMGTDVRVVKGIYREPEEIAVRDPDLIRGGYVRLLRLLLERGSVATVATHDDVLIEAALRIMEDLGLTAGDVEFQMLLGVREPLRDRLIAAGHRLRVYVPFGVRWYEYSVRRLRENPAIAGHVTKALLVKMFRRIQLNRS